MYLLVFVMDYLRKYKNCFWVDILVKTVVNFYVLLFRRKGKKEDFWRVKFKD